jgi:hypothetical protein
MPYKNLEVASHAIGRSNLLRAGPGGGGADLLGNQQSGKLFRAALRQKMRITSILRA